MKTVKFKDLPQHVRSFLLREIWFDTIVEVTHPVDLNWLHTRQEWCRATNEQCLAYAKWRYRKGVSYTPIRGGVECVVSGGEMLTTGGSVKKYIHESLNGESIINEADYYNLVFDGDVWAEIISEPEKEDFEMNASIKRDVEQVLAEDTVESVSYFSPSSKNEPEFKAGDEVEGRQNYWDRDVWDSVTYTGGKTKSGKPICEYPNGAVTDFDEIRKPDPDSKLREIAKELTEKYVKGTASSGKGGVFSPYKISEYVFEDNGLEQMLIEALKKGKDL